MKLYVGNLSWGTSEESLRSYFTQAGPVTDLRIITDRETGRSRGFAFVTMASEDASKSALQTLNQTDLDGRTIQVSEARGDGGAGGNRPPQVRAFRQDSGNRPYRTRD